MPIPIKPTTFIIQNKGKTWKPFPLTQAQSKDIPISYSYLTWFGSPHHSIRKFKKKHNKEIQIEKKVKLSPFTNDVILYISMILYIRNPKNSTRNNPL